MKKRICVVILISILILQYCPLARAATTLPAAAKAEEAPLSMVAPASMERSISSLVSAYKAKTGKTVDVEYVKNMDDYITNMNTEILAGEGQDIFLADSIPYWDYAKMGMLADIGKLIEKDPDMDINDYCENIIDPLRDANGKLYVMPCSYRFTIVYVNAPLLEKYGIKQPQEWTLEKVYDTSVEFTEKTKDVQGIYAMLGRSSFWSEALLSEISFAIDFNKGKSNVSELPDSLFNNINSKDEISSGDMYDQINMPYVFTLSYSRQETSFQFGRNPWGYVFFEHSDFAFHTFPRAKDRDKAMFSLENAFCINKNGNVEEAWEFIKFALSNDVQNAMTEVVSEPVLKSAVDYRFQKVREYLAKVMEKVRNGEDYSAMVGETKHTPDEFEGAVERYISNYTKLLDNVGVPELQDARLIENINSTLAPDQNGKIDPVAAKTEISQLVDVYLQEMGGDVQKGYTIIYIFGGVTAGSVALFIIIKVLQKKKRVPR